MRSVRASVNYLGDVIGRPTFRSGDPVQSNLTPAPHLVEIEDARTADNMPSLDREGFMLAPHVTGVRDFRDRNELQTRYLAEVVELIKTLTGATEVRPSPGVFVRYADRTDEVRAAGTAAPARYVHCDYTEISARRFFLPKVIDPERALAQYRRIVAYQTWRVLSQPPQDVPLAICDRRTCSPSEYVAADTSIDYRGTLQTFEFSLCHYDPQHRWHYFSNMRPDEVLVFKGYDFEPGAGPGLLHTAFDDPSAQGQEPRASIEARAFAFFD
jgi:hypothetical protein